MLLFFIAFSGTLAFYNLTKPKEVNLPSVVGLTSEEAQNKLKRQN